jgi:hypothetical protein
MTITAPTAISFNTEVRAKSAGTEGTDQEAAMYRAVCVLAVKALTDVTLEKEDARFEIYQGLDKAKAIEHDKKLDHIAAQLIGMTNLAASPLHTIVNACVKGTKLLSAAKQVGFPKERAVTDVAGKIRQILREMGLTAQANLEAYGQAPKGNSKKACCLDVSSLKVG